MKSRLDAKDNSFTKGTNRVYQTNETSAPSFTNNANTNAESCPCQSSLANLDDNAADETLEERYAKLQGRLWKLESENQLLNKQLGNYVEEKSMLEMELKVINDKIIELVKDS